MALPTCNVVCAMHDQEGAPVAGATFEFKLNRPEVYEGFVVPARVVGTTGDDGTCTVALWPNQLGSAESAYSVAIRSPGGRTERVTATIPNVATVNLHDVSALPPYPGKPDAQVYLEMAQGIVKDAQEAAAASASSASAASGSATAASGSATAASGSATAASGSATAASGSATAASASATAASGSAASAAGFSTAASESATAASGSATAAAASAVLAQTTVNDFLATGIGSHRNRIINGAMRVSVRGTSFPAATSYTLDRWAVGQAGGGVVAASQQADGPNTALGTSLRWEVTTADAALAAGDYALISQKIEGYNVAGLIGRPFTISFWARSSKTGTHCVAFRNSGLDRSYVAEYTITAANTWEFKTITVANGLITAGTWNWTTGTGLEVDFCLATGTTFQTAPGAWQVGSYIGTANQVNCLDTVGNIFAVTGVQLEPGAIATPFEWRMDEDRLCKRYARLFGRGVVGIWVTTSSIRVSDTFDTPMRATPSSTLLTSAPKAEDWAVIAYTATGATISSPLSTTTHGEFTVNGFSGPSATTPQRHAYVPADIAILTAEL